MHGGRIGAYNNPDRGATFYYELPALTDSINSGQQEVQETEISENLSIPLDLSATGISCAGYSLLIVEDKDELRLFLKDSFKDIFKQVYTAENGSCRPGNNESQTTGYHRQRRHDAPDGRL